MIDTSDVVVTERVPHDTRLYNHDLAPTTAAQRTWGTYNYIALWFSMSMEVTTYMLASSLIAGGMNWYEAVGTILLGNLIVLIPMLLNAHAGAKYGIPFPVFVRASFGVRGANIPAVLRAVVACGWFGIQSWIGGQSIAAMVNVLWPSTLALHWVVGVCFMGFWLLNMYVVWRGVESIRFLQSFSAPFLLAMSLMLLAYMTHKAGGFGPMLAAPSRFATTGAFLHFFFPMLTAMVNVLWPSTLALHWVVGVCFMGFWLLNMYVVWRGVESIRFLQSFSAPFLLAMSLMLLAYMTHKAGGFGPMLAAPSRFATTGAFLHFFFPMLTAMVGYWATLSLNIPDFTRYAKSQDSQIFGQAFGLPVAMTLYSFIGIACTSASTVVFGEPIWSPITLLGRFHEPLIAFVALVSILTATLNVNIGANVVSPSNDFSNLAPKYISFRTGGLITGVLGLAMMPWKLMATFGNYIFGWLVGYSGLLGPVAGIMVADYFLLRRRYLEVAELYKRNGLYEYDKGFNSKAIVALVVGVFCALIGLKVPALRFLYDYAWFVGFFLSGGVYIALMQSAPTHIGEKKAYPGG